MDTVLCVYHVYIRRVQCRERSRQEEELVLGGGGGVNGEFDGDGPCTIA